MFTIMVMDFIKTSVYEVHSDNILIILVTLEKKITIWYLMEEALVFGVCGRLGSSWQIYAV